MSPSPRMCRYFATANGCRYGDSCRFAHPEGAVEPAECQYYNTVDGCRYGTVCMFKHTEKKCTCFKCKKEFANTEELRTHLRTVLKQGKNDHIDFLAAPTGVDVTSVMCPACDKECSSLKPILQHIGGKSGHLHDDCHCGLLGEIVDHFLARCFDATRSETEWVKELYEEILISDMDGDHSAGASGLAYQLSRLLTLVSHDQDSHSDDDSFDDELEERMQNCGFTNDEVHELLCQGVKPWDPEAWDVMAVLNGDYEY